METEWNFKNSLEYNTDGSGSFFIHSQKLGALNFWCMLFGFFKIGLQIFCERACFAETLTRMPGVQQNGMTVNKAILSIKYLF